MRKLEFDSLASDCSYNIREAVSKEILPILKDNRDIIILCIGTDRSTGDSLGPLVGDKLKFLKRKGIYILGNLEKPIHAKNLVETLAMINSTYKNPYIIAIDACLGSLPSVGNVIIDSKPLTPGAALNKDLPSVGNLSITGVVNISGSLEFMVLQNTRLYVVMNLATVIANGIYHSIIKTVGSREQCENINIPVSKNEKDKLLKA
ncbi:spore protease YyaC [Clostridium senegalense]|uniref:Spore protease YyaC n=1 Tax=Clostridium senegalense TaxID=1465809 RepID=A0A6M0H0S8_9CLOT|nr:spore protease YyaC [Clostridium senegalense]NEU04380.1 spore protease YyaC [Clostridium senegalense]